MRELTVGSLFAGIGGFDLGLERAGMKVSWQIEIDEFCNAVLAKHWPNVPRFRDIKEVKIEQLDKVDIICGGFPCQPFSAAGKKRGTDDNRYLWPEMLRIIQGIHPTWVVGENVPGVINLALEDVCLDLEKEGYEVQSLIIPACGVNAPHKRDRVWVVAHRSGEGKLQQTGVEQEEWGRFSNNNKQDAPYSSSKSGKPHVQRCNRSAEQEQLGGNTIKSIVDRGSDVPTDSERWDIPWLPIAASLCRVDDGLPSWMVGHRVQRLKALGNAVVPQIVEVIGRYIVQVEAAKEVL